MIIYFLKLAIRKFQSRWLLFTGSIITVSTGALCISLLFSYVYNELSMNSFHKHKKDIYMMSIRISPESQRDPFSASQALNFRAKDYPELESLAFISKFTKGGMNVLSGESSFSPEIIVTDSSFFKVFDFKLLTGDKTTILSNPNAAIITKDFAHKMFGTKNPVGEVIKVNTNEEKSFVIQGVLEKLPSNSSITFDIILPRNSGSYQRPGVDFVLANEKFNHKEFEKKIENLSNTFFNGSKLSVMPLRDIYFYENPNFIFQLFFTRFGNKRDVYVLSIIMLIVFIITVFNFSGFQVIRINESIKFIGLGKTLGIKERELIGQKIVEIGLLIFLSLLIVTFAYMVILPYFNAFTKVALAPTWIEIIGLNLAIITVLFLLAMIYPSLITKRISISDSLKKEVFSGSFLMSQKAIVTIQYTLTIACIIASLVIFRQVSFMLNKDLGFKSKNVVRVNMYREKPLSFAASEEEKMKRETGKQKSYQYLRDQLASIPSIEAFSQGDGPVNPPIMGAWKLKGSEKDYLSEKGLFVQPGYLDVLGLKLAEGRFFDTQLDKSRDNKIVINEASKKYWGIKDIHECRMISDHGDSVGYEIIGVVKDFNYEHLSGRPQPMFISYFDDIRVSFLIKFREGTVQNGLQEVSDLFKQVNPGEEFSYTFLSDEVAALSLKEKHLGQIYLLFTLMSIFITAAGIFTIAAYDAQRRTKEIGIRKVNGAQTGEMMFMLNKDFLKLVFIAFLFACPIAWYAMHKWLENFAYKTTLSWWVFAAAGGIATVIALLTVSIQSWRAATRNPVESLRYE